MRYIVAYYDGKNVRRYNPQFWLICRLQQWWICLNDEWAQTWLERQ